MHNGVNRLAVLKSSAGGYYSEKITGSHEICMEQSVLNEEHVFARLVICLGLFEQLGPMTAIS